MMHYNLEIYIVQLMSAITRWAIVFLALLKYYGLYFVIMLICFIDILYTCMSYIQLYFKYSFLSMFSYDRVTLII